MNRSFKNFGKIPDKFKITGGTNLTITDSPSLTRTHARSHARSHVRTHEARPRDDLRVPTQVPRWPTLVRRWEEMGYDLFRGFN